MTVRMRHTRSHTTQRRAHHAIAAQSFAKDKSGNTYMKHRVSLATGVYNGKTVLDVNKKINKRIKKKEVNKGR